MIDMKLSFSGGSSMWKKPAISFIATRTVMMMIPTIIVSASDASPSSSLLNDSMNDSNNNVAFTMMITTGCITIALASALAYTILGSSKKGNKSIYNGSNASTENQLLDINGDTNKGSAIVDSNGHATTTSFDSEQYPGGTFSVYYGTQTGTAESFARVLEREGKQKGFLVHVIDLDDIQNVTTDFTSVERCVFLVATYGEGEPPDNAVTFVHSLQATSGLEILFEKSDNNDNSDDNKENANNNLLNKMDYAVFGLGNKQYDNYNAMGKYFDKVFDVLGGTRVVPLGLGDDDDDLENDFDTWKDTMFWPHFEKLYLPRKQQQKQQQQQTSSSQELPDSRYEIEYFTDAPSSYIHSTSTATDVYNSISSLDQVHSSSKHHFTSFDCPVRVVRELRNVNGHKEEDVGSTIHMEIDISNPIGRYNDGLLDYTTADNLGILPMNETAVVDTVASLLQLPNIDTTIFSLKSSPKHEWHGVPFPMPITIRECLTRYCDLTGPLRRSDLKLLASYATDPIDRKVLLRMSSKEGKNEYREKIVDSYVGMVDLLKLCPSISMPWEHFLNICSPMQSRFYTISSSSSVHPKSIHITVAVSQNIRQQDQTVFKGLCSNYLANCRPNIDSVRIFVRPSSFRLPTDITTPILMIGPGTGIAPMRALIQERSYLYKQQQQKQGKNILYFGCKKSTQDYIYEDELQSYVQDGTLDTLRVAFSREHNQKVYVQNLLYENCHETFGLIHHDKCYIYVCGGVKMGQDVHEILQKIIQQNLSAANDYGVAADHHAKEYLSKLSREHRYIQELWA